MSCGNETGRPPVIAPDHIPTEPIRALCGRWITICGKGKHRIVYNLGETMGPVTVWFRRESLDDEIYVEQHNEQIDSAPIGHPDGSFTFHYDPWNKKPLDDEIVLVHEGQTVESRVHIRLDCPVDECADVVVVKPGLQDTEMLCGRHHHQSGYVRKNTILLGDKEGYVNVVWSVEGSALVLLYQGDAVINRMTPNRSGDFQFYYKPENGDVYAITQGIGTVDYILSCPFLPEQPEVPDYSFTCDSGAYRFEAPQNVDVVLTDEKGTVDIAATVEETTQLTFTQDGVPFYVLSGHNGTVNFTLDYDPDNGPVAIQAAGYGDVAVSVKCPVGEIEPIPEDLRTTCGEPIETIPGFSNLTVHMDGLSGKSIIDLILTTPVIMNHNGATRTFTQSGSYEIDVNGMMPFVLESRGNNYQLRISCPVRQPINATMPCGGTQTFDSPANITVQYGSTAGNVNIKSDVSVGIYRDNVLVGAGQDVTFFFAPGNVVKAVSSEPQGTVTLQTTCPSIKQMSCGQPLTNFAGGDTINVNFQTPLIRGHVTFEVEILTGNPIVRWNVGGTLLKESTTSETFERIIRTQDGLRVVSTGTGTFRIRATCAIPIYIVSTEQRSRSEECPPGQTVGGVSGGRTTITATWNVYTWSDGTTTQSAEVWDGVCQIVAPPPIPKARIGYAMMNNINFTGGPQLPLLPDEDLYGVNTATAKNGTPYTHWAGVQAFCDAVMTTEIDLKTTVDYEHIGYPQPDTFFYIMWDKRAALDIDVKEKVTGFAYTLDGIKHRNEECQNSDWSPGYDPNLADIMEIQYDDGTGVRPWLIRREAASPTPAEMPYTDNYLIRYKV